MNVHIKPEVISVDAATVEKWLREDNVILVDVRETSEFDQEHIPGALLQPMSVFDPELFPKVPGKNVVLHCAVGKRSEAAGKMLINEGHHNIQHMSGGIRAWKDAGFETEELFIPPVVVEPVGKKPEGVNKYAAKSTFVSGGFVDAEASLAPADVLWEEFMMPLKIDVEELGQQIGVDESLIHDLLDGRVSFTAELSLRLARYFCTADDFWLNLQLKNDLQQATSVYGKSVLEAITPRLCH
jgi:addiction module HigA family antidote